MSSAEAIKVQQLLDEKLLLVNDGYRAKNSELSSKGLPFARAGNIKDGFQFDGADCIPRDDIAKVGIKVSEPMDVVFTSKGSVGRFALVRDDTPRFVYSPQLCFWRSLDHEFLDPLWLFYWMCSREFYVQFKSVSGQTDMAEYVSLTDQKKMKIRVPAIGVQREQAAILARFDDNIELNRKMNETLEQMARAIFKSWFVDFDPVRAKMDGRQPVGMDADTAALFPSEFEDSKLGKIPKGWKVGELENLLLLQRGFDLPKAKRVPGPHPIVSASGVSGSHTEAKVNGPGVTTGRSGLLGRVFLVLEDFWPLNTSLWVKEFRLATPAFAYHVLADLNLAAFNTWSAVATLNRNHIHSLPVVCPPKNLIDIFDCLSMTLFQMKKSNEEESATLAAIRDTLLPKLLSGEIQIRNSQDSVGRSAAMEASLGARA